MEEQLEIAENRCNTLKDQLDHMKKLYQHKTENSKSAKQHTKMTLLSSSSSSTKRNPVEFISLLINALAILRSFIAAKFFRYFERFLCQIIVDAW